MVAPHEVEHVLGAIPMGQADEPAELGGRFKAQMVYVESAGLRYVIDEQARNQALELHRMLLHSKLASKACCEWSESSGITGEHNRGPQADPVATLRRRGYAGMAARLSVRPATGYQVLERGLSGARGCARVILARAFRPGS